MKLSSKWIVLVLALVAASSLRADIEIPLSSLSGFVYHDANNDGVKNPSEAGIGGVTVTLTGTNFFEEPVFLTTTSEPF